MTDERQQGVDLFNGTWELMKRTDRTPDDDAAMVHMTHASAYHWSKVGTPENFARSEWQVSRVYAVLGRGEPSLWHAQRCLDLCTTNGIADWDLAFAHEAMARAYAVGGDLDRAREHVALARAVQMAEDDDRELVEADLG